MLIDSHEWGGVDSWMFLDLKQIVRKKIVFFSKYFFFFLSQLSLFIIFAILPFGNIPISNIPFGNIKIEYHARK
jgi:hypothetical protein